jgi:hypothetical protein
LQTRFDYALEIENYGTIIAKGRDGKGYKTSEKAWNALDKAIAVSNHWGVAVGGNVRVHEDNTV